MVIPCTTHYLKHWLAFNEYPVENFHSVLRAQTNVTDINAEQINLKARIDAHKHELHAFKSMFVPPRNFNFSRKRIDKLKLKAAEFLIAEFGELHNHPGMAVLLPRTKGQNKLGHYRVEIAKLPAWVHLS